jgi:hypothetical protein
VPSGKRASSRSIRTELVPFPMFEESVSNLYNRRIIIQLNLAASSIHFHFIAAFLSNLYNRRIIIQLNLAASSIHSNPNCVSSKAYSSKSEDCCKSDSSGFAGRTVSNFIQFDFLDVFACIGIGVLNDSTESAFALCSVLILLVADFSEFRILVVPVVVSILTAAGNTVF